MSKEKKIKLIISSFKSPLGFFALIALLVEIILSLFLLATDFNSLSIAIGMGSVFLGLLLAVFMLAYYRPEALYSSSDLSAAKLSLEKEVKEVKKLELDTEKMRIQLQHELAELNLKVVRKALEELSISENKKLELTKKLLEITSTGLKVPGENESD